MATKLLIFGITGDLSTRKLLPALRQIMQVDEFRDLQLYGVSRRQVNKEELLGDLAPNAEIITMDIAKVAAIYQNCRNIADRYSKLG